MESIFTFIAEQYPTIGGAIILILVAYNATMYHVSIQRTHKKVDKHQRKIAAVEKIVDDLPCDTHRKAIVNIEKTLLGKKDFKAKLAVTFSPRRLTEFGRELYQKSGMQAVLESNILHFVEKLEVERPKTALDVEDLANWVLFKSTDEDFFIPVKNWLYNNPALDEEDIDMSDICYVASLELRDAYLKKHPEILPDDNK